MSFVSGATRRIFFGALTERTPASGSLAPRCDDLYVYGQIESDLSGQGDSVNVPKNTRKLAFYVYMKALHGICEVF